MPFVIDASISACWIFPDEDNLAATSALARLSNDSGIVPDIWWFEMHNLLLTNERRRRIDGKQTSKALGLLARLPIDIDHSPDSTALLQLARRHQLSAYDAAYLELALRQGVPLATIDGELLSAARKEKSALL